MIRSEDMKEKLSDSGYVEMDGRFCLMIKNTYKKGIGVVHSSSNTGRSLYVEPFAIVEPTNEMRSTLVQIKIEENKILYDMMKCISKHINDIKRALNAVAEVDVFRAKAKLGKILNGIIPEVGNEGQIRCVNAKHPVLLLRGVNPIDNKIVLNESASALVISGPNAGGKTVILKMAGLFALMAQHSIPIPAKYGARIDLLNVMADIDEIGTGTDPAQGAALAQAILEELVNLNARVIVTTHYNRIKELASKDHRFSIAAMEFIDNKPTYRLKLGYIGESYALEADLRGYGDLSDAQIYTNTYLEKFLDREKSVSVIYINHGNSKTAEALKPRYRNWLKRHPLISKAYPAELTDGGDSYTVIELCDDD
eukprot:gene19183-25029_t